MANYNLLPAHWAPNSTVTWYYSGTASAVFTLQQNNGYPTPDLFPAELQAAFNKWDSYSGGITFQQVFSPSQANIVVGWGGIDGPGGTIGQASYSYFPSTGLFASSVQIKFDWSELYNPTSGTEKFASNGASFFSVALHEIGHAIGIDHYTGGPAIMNPFINPSINDLTASDIAAIQALYGTGALNNNEIVWDFSWKLASVGDFNNDGTTDIIWLNDNGLMGGWLMQGNIIGGTLQMPFFPGWTSIASGDFNGDGVDDVLWKNADGLIAEWFMGQGTRQGTMTIQNMTGWNLLGTGDFNGDGTTDIVWQDANGTLGSWVMKNGQIAGTLELPFFPGWKLIATGDFNGDGVDDLLWQNASGVVGEWLMGNGTRAATFSLGSMAGWTAIGDGDFNGDGFDDVLWKDAGGTTKAWLMKNGAVLQEIFEGNSANLEFVAVGDFNGDGLDDIMWQDTTTGNVSIWKMGQGGVVTSVSNPMLSEDEVAAGLATGTLAFHEDTFDFLPPEQPPPAGAAPVIVAGYDIDVSPEVLLLGAGAPEPLV